MRRDIRCETCNEVMGTLAKPTITSEDIDLYRQMVTCSNGHGGVTELTEVPEEEED